MPDYDAHACTGVGEDEAPRGQVNDVVDQGEDVRGFDERHGGCNNPLSLKKIQFFLIFEKSTKNGRKYKYILNLKYIYNN